MIGEIDLQGVLVQPLIVWMAIAYVISIPLRALLARIGFYRLVWHRALFDISVYAVLTWGVSVLANHWMYA